MDFDDQRVSVRGVDDRRGRRGGRVGRRGGVALGGGAGVVGLLVVVLLQVLGGGQVDLSQLGVAQGPGQVGQVGQVPGETLEDLDARCNADGALDQYTDCRLIKVYNVADEVWAEQFSDRSSTYRSPSLVFFSGATQTGCGQASAAVGPFYCPPDEGIFFDLDFLAELQNRFGASGSFAQAYIAAHEFGHHLQTLLGTSEEVRNAQAADPARANDLSVALELQADCYAGAWSRLADERGEDGIGLDAADVAEAVAAAEAVGDDRIQEATTGRTDPESWTHGSAEQRRQWFERGLASGRLEDCDTFA